MHRREAISLRASALALVVLLGCATPPAARHATTPPPVPTATPLPQAALPEQLRAREAVSRQGMVVTSAGTASWAGAQVLEAGGNAVDAAVAAALALGAAEPGSSGLGGQTYILIRLADGRSVAIDGSARSPLRCSAEAMQKLRDDNQDRHSFYSYRLVATPGSLAALSLALRRYGTMSLAQVAAPAIAVAELGARLTPAQHSLLKYYLPKVQQSPYLSRLFLVDGVELWGPDHVYCNPDLARTLRRLAELGADDFYRGGLAARLADDVEAHGGWLRAADFAMMTAQERRPLTGRYRGLEVLSFPFPGGGGAVVESLGILDRFPPQLLRDDSVDRLHLLVEAGHLAFADTNPAQRPPRSPDEAATDPAFLDRRGALIRFDRALWEREISQGALSSLVVDGTTQVSTADDAGNVVALTQTLGATFGSGAATEGTGFVLNSLMNGFDFQNRRLWTYLAPLQPPMNSMAPTIVLDRGRPLLVLGSAGSARIAPVIVSTISGVVDRRLPLCEVMGAPRALWGGNVENFVYLELVDPVTTEVADALKARGFADERLTYPAPPLWLTDYGGANAIWIDPADGTMVGVGDPRRQAVAAAPGDGDAWERALTGRELWGRFGGGAR